MKYNKKHSRKLRMISDRVAQIANKLSGLVPFKDADGRWGFANPQGEVIVPCQWKNVAPFSDGLAGVMDFDDKVGFIDTKGNIVIPCKWKNAKAFRSDMSMVEDESGWHYIDRKGDIIKG